jgi:hypothetical protein
MREDQPFASAASTSFRTSNRCAGSRLEERAARDRPAMSTPRALRIDRAAGGVEAGYWTQLRRKRSKTSSSTSAFAPGRSLHVASNSATIWPTKP